MKRTMATKKSKEVKNYYIEYGINLTTRCIYLASDVDDFTISGLIRAIQLMEDDSKDKEITIYISSPGGEVYAGLALYDVLRESKCPIKTICLGSAMSMGLIIFLAGDIRLSYKSSSFMAHCVSGGMLGKLSDMEIDIKESKRLNSILLDILEDRTKRDRKWWEKEIKHEDKYYNPEKAKELGIITEIV